MDLILAGTLYINAANIPQISWSILEYNNKHIHTSKASKTKQSQQDTHAHALQSHAHDIHSSAL